MRLQHTGAAHMHGAVRLPGNTLFPRKLVAAMYRESLRVAAIKGISVSLHVETTVKSVSSTPDTHRLLQTTRGSLLACDAVLAARLH
jgi:hypothetical protein